MLEQKSVLDGAAHSVEFGQHTESFSGPLLLLVAPMKLEIFYFRSTEQSSCCPPKCHDPGHVEKPPVSWRNVSKNPEM